MKERVEPNGMWARIMLAFLTTAGIFYINIMPAVVSGLKEGLAFTSQEAGFVSSANQHPTSSDYPYYLGWFFPQYRGKRINQKLSKMNSIIPDDCRLLQLDALSIRNLHFFSSQMLLEQNGML
jgi:hypothetical protein